MSKPIFNSASPQVLRAVRTCYVEASQHGDWNQPRIQTLVNARSRGEASSRRQQLRDLESSEAATSIL